MTGDEIFKLPGDAFQVHFLPEVSIGARHCEIKVVLRTQR